MKKIQTIINNSTNAVELNLLLLCLRIFLKTEPATHLAEYICYNRKNFMALNILWKFIGIFNVGLLKLLISKN